MPTTPPVIMAYEHKGYLRFWCPHCMCWHVHGAAEGDGLRAAHCYVDDSPYIATGYIIKTEPITPAIEQAIKGGVPPRH